MTTVRSGWNSEPYGRRKFDVELGEGDLTRILTEHGIDSGKADRMPLRDAFRILYCEAEILARYALVRHLDAEEAEDAKIDAVKAEIRVLTVERNEILAPYTPKRAAKTREPVAT